MRACACARVRALGDVNGMCARARVCVCSDTSRGEYSEVGMAIGGGRIRTVVGLAGWYREKGSVRERN